MSSSAEVDNYQPKPNTAKKRLINKKSRKYEKHSPKDYTNFSPKMIYNSVQEQFKNNVNYQTHLNQILEALKVVREVKRYVFDKNEELFQAGKQLSQEQIRKMTLFSNPHEDVEVYGKVENKQVLLFRIIRQLLPESVIEEYLPDFKNVVHWLDNKGFGANKINRYDYETRRLKLIHGFGGGKINPVSLTGDSRYNFGNFIKTIPIVELMNCSYKHMYPENIIIKKNLLKQDLICLQQLLLIIFLMLMLAQLYIAMIIIRKGKS